MSELTKRVCTGVFLGLVVVFAIAYLPYLWLEVAVALIILVTGFEWVTLITSSVIMRGIFILLLIALGIVYYLSPQWPIVSIVCFLVTCIAIFIGMAQVFIFARSPQSCWVKTKWLRCLVALPILAGADHIIVALRHQGAFWLFYCIALVVVLDSGGYFVGRSLGRTKLAPNVSPKKTWGGYFGGLILGLVLSALMMFIVHFSMDLSWKIGLLAAVMTVVISIFAVLGDLFESVQKRLAGKKDSANILPGHGGFFDRIDGLLFVLPVMFIYHGVFVFLMHKQWVAAALQALAKH
jgi:phosphatidate cytidylyltransferase